MNAIPKPALRSPFPPGTPGIQQRPPFRFLGTTTRVFPIKANMSRLRSFCDDYLNCGNNPFYRFQPAIPYVYVMVLDYGKMAVVAENLGWIAQHEITFTIPLEWYEWSGGRWVFRDWAGVSPFIFVDNEISQTTGREVYGWPKIKAWLDPRPTSWTEHPRNPSRLMRLSTRVFPRVYEGKRSEPGVLMEVWREPPLSFTQLPPALTGDGSLVGLLSGMVTGSLQTLRDGVSLLARLPLTGYGDRRSPESLMGMLRSGLKGATPIGSNPAYNQLTLKQFRDAHQPEYLCYQAIVNSVMAVDRFNGGGMLGDTAILRGDTSGGFSIRMHRYTSQPIVDTLGLECEDLGFDDKGIPVAKLRPSFPFWLDMDLNYGTGVTLCWRTLRSPWIKGTGRDAGGVSTAASGAATGTPNYYNTARGAAIKSVPGPFSFPDVTLRILPLLADPKRLQELCDGYLNGLHAGAHDDRDDAGFEYVYKAFGSYVYLVATHYGDQLGTMSSETNDIGSWAEREVAFYVPVKWYRKLGERLEHVSFGLVAPFVFAESGQEVITDREVNGRATIRAGIESPPDAWMNGSGPNSDRAHLTLTTRLFPALNLGQRGEERTLLEIDGADALDPQDVTGWRQVKRSWGDVLLEDHRHKIAIRDQHRKAFAASRKLAMELLVNRQPFNAITLKQYRDAEAPDLACYQALVRTRKVIEEVHHMQEIEERLHVRIRRYQSLPIVDTLGLKVKCRVSTGGVVADVLQPLRSFWLRASIREENGDNLCVRTGGRDESWAMNDVGAFYFDKMGPAVVDEPTDSGAGTVGSEVSGSKSETTGSELAEPGNCFQSIGEPQAIIDSLLSTGWEHWRGGDPDLDGIGSTSAHKPDFCVRRDSIREPEEKDRSWPQADVNDDPVSGWYSEDSSEQ